MGRGWKKEGKGGRRRVYFRKRIGRKRRRRGLSASDVGGENGGDRRKGGEMGDERFRYVEWVDRSGGGRVVR